MVEGKGRRAKKVERAEEMAEARMGRERKSGEKVIKAFMMLAGGGGTFGGENGTDIRVVNGNMR